MTVSLILQLIINNKENKASGLHNSCFRWFVGFSIPVQYKKMKPN